jgi:hypothetical protein
VALVSVFRFLRLQDENNSLGQVNRSGVTSLALFALAFPKSSAVRLSIYACTRVF